MPPKKNLFFASLTAGIGLLAVAPTAPLAQDVLSEKNVALSLAQEAATAAIDQCRKDGYRVTVAVVDRSGQVKIVLRDDGASPHTLDSSRRKAYTALTFRTSTTELTKRMASNPAAANIKDIHDIIALGGGLALRVGDEVIGAIGVGGAPGGDKDEICAQAGIDKIAGRLK